jgi:phosphoribosylformylglycinamidine synthase II
MSIRIEVRSLHTSAAEAILHGAAALGIGSLQGCTIDRLYFIEHDLSDAEINRLCTMLLVDPVTEQAQWRPVDQADSTQVSSPATAGVASGNQIVEVTYRPGVTDIAARELARGMAEIGIDGGEVVTGIRYELQGELEPGELRRLARQLLSNETVQHFSMEPTLPHFGAAASGSKQVEQVSLHGLNEEELLALSRRRLLSLDANEMRAIQNFYQELGRSPTDVELETLAQTWSEHCVHKTFRAEIDFTWQDEAGTVVNQEVIDGLLRTYIRAATEAISPPWLRSAFVDDAGIVAFDDTHDLAFKVETHNHPSALEPFGGANTGVGGVVRDILGVSARPIAATNVLCFGPQDYPHSKLPAGLLHPQRIASGVVAGIGDYGNKLGLPTVNGAVFYDEGYLGNPLVFCGCAGLLPTGKHPTNAQAGDQVVVLGGRTGRDGLHGATFSSAELSHDTSETAGSAVQIGDPITEKGLIELIEAARDAALYTAITDCGAGGLSSAVGEMGNQLGVDVELTHVTLKYPGLVPWEIWLSEAQERLVLAVPAANLPRLHELAKLWDVEVSVLGTFTGDGDLRVRYEGDLVADLPMEFLHDGLPRRHMKALWRDPAQAKVGPAISDSPSNLLLRMLAHPNIASKEEIVRRYDHEVRGGTIVRPFGGPHMDGPNDAAVLKPLGTWDHERAFSLSVGINPQIGRRDPYAMAISAIDEAIRNAVAVGADPDQLSILDNFCWGNPTLPDRLGALVRTCQGCYDGATAYRAPFISGKDSLYNEYNGTPIPGTLLISAIAIVPDMNRAVTAACKSSGNLLYVVGATHDELGGSLLHALHASAEGTAPTLPVNGLENYRRLHQAIRAGLIRACHDLSEGGLALALAEMALGGRLGIDADLTHDELSALSLLFSESNGRLVIEVAEQDATQMESLLAGTPLTRVGVVTKEPRFRIAINGTPQIDLPVESLVSAWLRQPAREVEPGALE